MLKNFIKDLAKYSLSQFLPAATAFITTPILTRLFPPSEYGLWALAQSIGAFLVAVAASGFGSAVIRYYPAYKARSTLHVFFASLGVSFNSIILLVAGISSIVIISFKELFPETLFSLLPVIILLFIAQSIYTVFMALTRTQERSGTYTLFELLSKYGGLGAGLLLVIGFGLRIDGLLWGAFLILALILPFLILRATRKIDLNPKHFRLSDAQKMAEFAWPLSLGNVAMWGLRLSDLFIINHFLTEKDVGLYSVSYNISSKSVELLVALFLLSVAPLVMNTWEAEGKIATEKSLTTVTRVYLMLCLPATVGVTVLAYPLVALLTAPEYYEGYKIVGFVAFSSFTWGLANIAQMGIAIKKQTRLLAGNQILASLIHIGLALLLVPRFGYAAAAVTTLAGYSILLMLNSLASRQQLTWMFPFKSLRNILIATLLMGGVAWGVYSIPGVEDGISIPYLFLSIALASGVYAACLWLLGEVMEDEKNKIFQLWHRLTRHKE